MCASSCKFRRQDKSFQVILSSPLKDRGYVPETGSEVFVKDIAREVNEYQLLELFQTVGDVFQVRLLIEPEKKCNRGLAYIQYTNKRGADAAVRLLHGRKVGSNPIHVEVSFNNCRIFIGGIPVAKSKDDVWRELARQGIENIVDVIMYRSYNSRAQNRGFVFLEFNTHEEAAHFRAKHAKLQLFGSKLIVDWAIPMPEIDEHTMQEVKVIYLRNLQVIESPEDLKKIIFRYSDERKIEKIYKFKNYAFIHVVTRQEAEILMNKLIDHYRGTQVEVTWSKPPSRYTKKQYRQQKLTELSTKLPQAKPSTSKLKPISSIAQPSTSQCKTVEPLLEDFSNLVPFEEIQPFFSEGQVSAMARTDDELRAQIEEMERLSPAQVAAVAFSGRLTEARDNSEAGAAAATSSSGSREAASSDELDTFDLQKMLREFMDM